LEAPFVTEKRGVYLAGLVGTAVFVDVETTGLDEDVDEIIELALVEFEFDWATGEIVRLKGTYQGLRQPRFAISQASTEIHGLTAAAVQGHALADNPIRAMMSRSDFVVAHNAQFDRRFVLRLYPWAEALVWCCSMRQINWRRRGHLCRHLRCLAQDGGLAHPRHRALDDCLTALALLRLTDDERYPLADILSRLSYEPRTYWKNTVNKEII
jgi:DNA polymerase-3 subunit epsilon